MMGLAGAKISSGTDGRRKVRMKDGERFVCRFV